MSTPSNATDLLSTIIKVLDQREFERVLLSDNPLDNRPVPALVELFKS